MNKENKHIELVPKFRFPEFVEDGEWKEKMLGDCLNGKSSQIAKNKLTLVEKGYPIYGADGLIGYIEIFTQKKDYIAVVKDGSGVGNLFLYKEKSSLLGTLTYLLSKDEKKYNLSCLYYLLQTIDFKPFVKGSGIPHIYFKDYSKLKIYLPNPQEQQKIANTLSSLDALLQAETERLALLKEHKKGLLQQLFPKQGEKVPQLRFEEFVGDGDWEEKSVDEYFEVCSSKRVLQKDWKNEGVPFYRTRELVSLSKNEPFGSEIYITEELFIKLSQKYGVPKTGDFLVSGVGTLGILYQVKEGDKFYFKDGNVIWFKLGKGIKSDFFKYSFQTTFFQKQIFGQSSASTVGTYTITNARKTKFCIPLNVREQQKIANTLSSVDELIETQSEKIDSLKAHKKGLLQGMFPKIEN